MFFNVDLKLDISSAEIDSYLYDREARVETALEECRSRAFVPLPGVRAIADEPSTGLAIILSFRRPARQQLEALAA